MKKGLHPETYRLVAFKDMSNDTVFVTRSCAETKETLVVDGVEYPVVKVEISNTVKSSSLTPPDASTNSTRDTRTVRSNFCHGNDRQRLRRVPWPFLIYSLRLAGDLPEYSPNPPYLRRYS